MEIKLAHFTLHSPDELLSYWFVSHDFAGALGLEYSKEAAKVLKKTISTHGIKIDYEADAVTVRTSRKAAVIPALREIYRCAGWDAGELDGIESQVLTFKRPQRRAVSTGDVFLVPIDVDLFGMGQVLDLSYRIPTIAVFSCTGKAAEMENRRPEHCSVLTIVHIHGSSLYTGRWPIIGSAPVELDPGSGPKGRLGTVGSSNYGGDGPVRELLRAHAGLDDWVPMFGDPAHLRKLVMGCLACFLLVGCDQSINESVLSESKLTGMYCEAKDGSDEVLCVHRGEPREKRP
jgi:hypothetical protein